jgi:hypothetical protein
VNDERRAIGHQRSDPIAGLQTECEILLGESRAQFGELPPTHFRLSRDERDVVGFLSQPVAEQISNRSAAREGRSGEGHDLILMLKQCRKAVGRRWAAAAASVPAVSPEGSSTHIGGTAAILRQGNEIGTIAE